MMCAKADRCGTFTLPLPLPFTFTLLWTDYGDDGIMSLVLLLLFVCCCLLIVVDDDVLLLAAAVAAAHIGGNISYLHVPYLTLPQVGTSPYIPPSCSVCSMSFFLFDDTIYE